MGTLHVVGAGLAGLAAATSAVERGAGVVLWEMARHAGGRCRSFDDVALERRIDNGNHLLLSGNRAVRTYLRRIGSEDRMVELPARFPFVDLEGGERWTVRPNGGPLPWWVLSGDRRPKGASLAAVLAGFRLLLADRRATVADVLASDDPAYRRFWEPLAVGVLNCDPAIGSARLLRPVLLETFARGAGQCRPWLARTGLGDALIEPAVDWLRAHGAEVRLGARVETLGFAEGRVTALRVAGAWVALGADDAVVVATPPWTTAALVPGLAAPDAYTAILNAHFRLPASERVALPSLLGVVGGLAQWIFRRDDVAAVTVSAADAVIDRPPEQLAERLWREVQRALDLELRDLPPYRIVKEKRATPLQSPAAATARWPSPTAWANLALAGDWTATGLPATLEGAVRSGEQAARLLVSGTMRAVQHNEARPAASLA
ncbi:MAG: hydroxysqualene dehydroxylase HpnE [Pseudomonadota bacterium]